MYIADRRKFFQRTMFEYKRPISSIIKGPRFAVAQIGNIYCVVAPVENFYKVYGAEKLNTLGQSRDGLPICSIAALRRYVVAAEKMRIGVYNQGEKIQEIEMPREIEEVVAYDEFLVVRTKESLLRVDPVGMEKIEDEEIQWKVTELLNVPKGVESIHKLALKNKLMIVAQGKVHIYSVSKDSIIYTLKCIHLGARVVDASNSISSEIVALCTERDVYVLQLKKDILLQQFSCEAAQSIDFRRSMCSKELALLTDKEVVVFCLEQAVAKKRYTLTQKVQGSTYRASPHTARYIGTDGYLVISQENELQILDCQHDKIIVVKKRAGVVFGEEQCAEFLNDTLIISTNGRVYSLSLRKEEQLRELSKMNAQGRPVSLSVVRDRAVACYSKGLHALKETVGGLTETKRRLGHSTPKEYIGAIMSFCSNALAISIKESEARVKILIASRESGFILGEVEETPYLALALNNIKKTLTVMHDKSVAVYSYSGEVVYKADLNKSSSKSSEIDGEERAIQGQVVETRSHKYYVQATSAHVHIFNEQGAEIKKIAKMQGAPIRLRISSDLTWILVMTQQKEGAVLEIVDMESSTVISAIPFGTVPKDFIMTKDKSRLVVIADRKVLLFSNTYRIQKVQHGASDIPCEGIRFSSAQKSRIRLLLMYETFGSKLEKECPLAPYAAEKENAASERSLSSKSSAVEGIDALLDGNYPISLIVAYIKETENPAGLLAELVDQLETKYDVAEALINRVLYYRRKDLTLKDLQDSLRKREGLAERFITMYLSALALTEKA